MRSAAASISRRIRAAGLTTLTAHAIKRPTEVELFGWKETPVVTDDDRARHAQAEAMTNDMLAPAFGVARRSRRGRARRRHQRDARRAQGLVAAAPPTPRQLVTT